VIGSVVNVSSYGALAGAGLAGLTGNASSASDSNASLLLNNAGATLQALNNGRDSIDQIKSALTQLRDTLQAARDQANAVPGRTELRPVVADVEQTRDKPTYVTIGGAVVQNGSITVSLGARPLIVGYETANRASLEVSSAVKSLASTVATLVSTVGTNNGFAADVSALLQSKDFTTAVNTPNAAAIDAAIGQINDTLAKAAGLGTSLSSRQAAAAQVDLGSLLLNAAPNAGIDTSAATSYTGSSAYQSNASGATGSQVSTLA
jgi:hypothetical protein